MRPILLRSDGTVLILVLWVLAIITLIGGYFALEARISRNVSGVAWRDLQAEAAVKTILTVISPHLANEQTAAGGSEGGLVVPDGRRYHLKGQGLDVWFSVQAESGKLDINQADEAMLAALIQELGGPPGAAQAILDWRDRDGDPRPDGAEDSYYRSLTLPYGCPNRPFETVDELLMVKGITPDLFWGPITYPLESEETQWKGGLVDLVTIYSKRKTASPTFAPLPIKSLAGEIAAGSGRGGGSGVFCLKLEFGGAVIRAYWSPEGKSFKLLDWMETPG